MASDLQDIHNIIPHEGPLNQKHMTHTIRDDPDHCPMAEVDILRLRRISLAVKETMWILPATVLIWMPRVGT
jgi:hypothetical protein